MWQFPIETRTIKYAKRYGFSSFARKCKKQLLDTGLDLLKTNSKKVDHETGEFFGNKIADAVTNLYNYNLWKQNLLKK